MSKTAGVRSFGFLGENLGSILIKVTFDLYVCASQVKLYYIFLNGHTVLWEKQI